MGCKPLAVVYERRGPQGPRAYLSAKVELEVPAATATKGTPSRLAASIHATASGVLGMYLDGKA
eukprot:scaffold6637_cov78-Phaeocystis_antarctica.AAC.3